ncbi:hypothetical protein [Tardiphaga sp. 768_D3_N2_1]|uniref:hypothetical protein n=1 Tax=Tardiphaga sp. 768_D3_N2_1 TaxID=3240783 RepID=UPI003F89CFC4
MITSKEELLQIQPLYPVLVDLQLLRAEREIDDDVERENFINGRVNIYRDAHSDVEIASCEFSAGERLKGTDEENKSNEDSSRIVELRATYAVGLRNSRGLSDNQIERVFEDVATASAWQLFRSLFAQVVSQCTVELPQLPPHPSSVASEVMQGDD